MDQATINALDEYYKLKDEYETANRKARRKIVRDRSLDKSAKLQALASLKTKCANCGKLGGMVFSSEGNILKARCTASQGPCSLDIEINRGDFQPVVEIHDFISDETEDARTNIIRTKLNMLFGFITESEAMSEFVDQKDEFDSLEGSLRDIDEIFTNVVQGKKTLDQRKNTKETIRIAVDTLRQLSKKYQETNDPGLINEMVTHYINEIQPEATKYRELRFAKNEIECSNGEKGGGKFTCDDGIYYLIQDPYTYQEAEVVMEEPTVLKNNK
tara:strand:- start:49 stop:864 length:816 start_codon:yes stop_codon:yes gene_type:complete